MSTSYAEAFPARTSASLEAVPGWRASIQDYGLRSPLPFATFDPATSSWRTRQRSLFGDLEQFSRTWPASGMTRSGTAYRRRPSAPVTYEHAHGLWPTPLATETGWRKKPYSQGGRALSTVIGGPQNPEWTEWLMGFPIGWTDCERSETP